MLTKNFRAKEFLVSDLYPELAHKVMLSSVDLQNLYLLCSFGLQRVRDQFGEVRILSGKRSVDLNSAIGGATNSQHLRGMAADFVCPSKNMGDVFMFCKSELRWPGECIHYIKKNFVHLALPEMGVKSDVMVKE